VKPAAPPSAPPRLAQSKRPVWLPAVIALTLLGGAVLFLFNPANHGFYPSCLFYKTTGLLCPGCGTLRACHQLLHGHLLMALRCNLLVVLSIPLLTVLALGYLSMDRKDRPRVLVRPLWLWVALAVLVLFGVLRNIPFVPFVYLAP